MRWYVIERATLWIVIAFLAGWLYTLTNWVDWLDAYQNIQWDMIRDILSRIKRTYA